MSTLSFAASCDRVADMLVNPLFAHHVAAEIRADNVTTTDIEGGLTAVFTLVSPSAARRFLGPNMTITETTTWEQPLADGVRIGRLTLSMAGVPARADGPLDLKPTPTGSLMVYDADFTVKIPLFGKKIEQMAETYLINIIQACESVGNKWLAENS